MTLPTLESTSPKLKEWTLIDDALEKKCGAAKLVYVDSKAREKGVEKNHAQHIENVRTGGVSTAPSVTAIAADAYAVWSDLFEAREEHRKLKRSIVQQASREYNAKWVKPILDPVLKKIGAALCDVQAGLLEYYQIRNDLHSKLGIEPVGLANISFYDVLGIPTDKGSKLADLLRDLQSAGAISRLPKEIL
jgi:hypothetical protein